MTKKKLLQVSGALVAAGLIGLSASIATRWGGSNVLFLGALTNQIEAICAETTSCRSVERMSAFSRETGRVESFYLATLKAQAKAADYRGLQSSIGQAVQKFQETSIAATVVAIRQANPVEVRYAQ